MPESNIDVRIVFTDSRMRDQLQAFLESFNFEKAEADEFAIAYQQLESMGLDPQRVFGVDPSYVAISSVKAMGTLSLEFHVQGGVNAAPDFTGKLIQALKESGTKEIIYADLNDQFMEIGVYYHSDKSECSYETGFNGDADEALWEADNDGILLDTVRELALNNQLKMPAFD